jgi:CBS domain-containing protein
MRESHIGSIIVVDEPNGKRIPAGILTDRDIVVVVVALGLEPNAIQVGDVMSQELGEPLNKSYVGATVAFQDEMREARRSEWLTPFASRATKQVARKTPSSPGFGAMRRLRRCAPRA